MGEKVHWPSHKQIDVYTKDLIKQLRENNVNLGKVYSIIGSFFGSVEKVTFTKGTLKNICGKISREQAEDDVRKTLQAFADIQANAIAKLISKFFEPIAGIRWEPSPPSRMDSASSAWSTTHLPADVDDTNGEGEVVQQDESVHRPLTHDLGSMVGQDSREEGFGDYDPAAAPDSPRSTGSSAIDDQSGVMCGGNVEDSEDEEDIISMLPKHRCIID
uniref:Uncharacterized protein n=1 Tax=Aegilops tauschii TaxID=37682 RepID=N1QQF4_AEGTA